MRAREIFLPDFHFLKIVARVSAACVVQHSVVELRLLLHTSIPVACHLKNCLQTNTHGAGCTLSVQIFIQRYGKETKFVCGTNSKAPEELASGLQSRHLVFRSGKVARNAPIPLYLSFAQRKQS
jgi:hypothetical protein